jgi:hypothetical protein
MNSIPSNKEIPVEILAAIFHDTTNSYKYYWFLSILDILQNSNDDDILIDDLCEKMIESIWYPLNFFKLSFGSQDQFKNIADLINLFVDVENSNDTIVQQIHNKADDNTLSKIKLHIKRLARWVPYRFIRPFFKNELRGFEDSKVNNAIIQLANNLSNQNPNLVPYYFADNRIILNIPWKIYLKQNMGLIRGFILWKLLKFVQKNNPNVLGLSGKLFKPSKRDLSLNNKSWEFYYKMKKGMQCIYSKTPIPVNFSLDHFIPWTYTVHDLNWNIIPVSKEINSSKSNNLPSIEKYLDDFISLQWDFIRTIYHSNFENKNNILEHYCLLFNDSSSNILSQPKQFFKIKLVDTFQPMIQIAANMGFPKDWTYKA